MRENLTIQINETEELTRFQRATWKQGRMLEQPSSAKQVYNLQADSEDSADQGLMHDSYLRWLWAGINIMSEYLVAEPTFANNQLGQSVCTITITMPQNWVIHSMPGMKYAMRELIHNGMMADWYDDVKQDSAKTYKQKAEVNKAEIQSIIYALNAP